MGSEPTLHMEPLRQDGALLLYSAVMYLWKNLSHLRDNSFFIYKMEIITLVAKVCCQDNLTSWAWKHFAAIKIITIESGIIIFISFREWKNTWFSTLGAMWFYYSRWRRLTQCGTFWRETWVWTSVLCVNCNLVKAFIQILELEIVANKV